MEYVKWSTASGVNHKRREGTKVTLCGMKITGYWTKVQTRGLEHPKGKVCRQCLRTEEEEIELGPQGNYVIGCLK